ncbi:MAG: hypothetical protein K8R88_05115, partial [Armatimonadetes bacterium]|nr:hypothetical protein [Armatimonadota bacterium]
QSPSRDLLPSCPIGYAMRPTGGRAVLHGHDITVAYALPLRSLGLEEGTKSVTRAYRQAVPILLEAMQKSGQPASLGEEVLSQRANPTSPDCFAHVSANDIVDPRTGLKVCGCALRLTDRAVLVHASIPIQIPKVSPEKVFSQPAQLTINSVCLATLESQFALALDKRLQARV